MDLQDFYDFIYERQRIWHKRFVLKEEPPWTEDSILRKFKIINMYRELDRCTIYYLNRMKGLSRESLFLNTVFYRFFNRSGLYEELGIEPFSGMTEELSEGIIQRFNSVLESGKPIFNNAYLISSGGRGKKHVNILNNLVELSERVDNFVERLDSAKTPEGSFDVIKEIPMVGPFLACEIWTDLSYFDFFKQGWDDNDFVNIGPGAKWGLEILFGKLKRKELYDKLYELRDNQEEMLPAGWKDVAYRKVYSNYPYLSITNIEGALCEFRKYTRLKEGKGKKRYYKSQYR